MPIVTMTSKGRVTLPVEIRKVLDLKPKDKLYFTLLPDHTIIIRTKK